MRRLLLLLALLVALLIPGVAQATYYPSLDALASYWAQRPIQVSCPEDWAEDPWATGAWGYTFMHGDETRIDPMLCNAALALNQGKLDTTPDWQVALSVLVITHEAFHLRNWKWNGNEGRVECKAIQNWPQSFLILSHWNLPVFRRTMSYALAEHYGIAARFPEYNYKKCKIGWWPPW